MVSGRPNPIFQLADFVQNSRIIDKGRIFAFARLSFELHVTHLQRPLFAPVPAGSISRPCVLRLRTGPRCLPHRTTHEALVPVRLAVVYAALLVGLRLVSVWLLFFFHFLVPVSVPLLWLKVCACRWRSLAPDHLATLLHCSAESI
jgi:hypothetical protein